MVRAVRHAKNAGRRNDEIRMTNDDGESAVGGRGREDARCGKRKPALRGEGGLGKRWDERLDGGVTGLHGSGRQGVVMGFLPV